MAPLSKEDYIKKVFSPRFIIKTLKTHNLALNKNLGQNFLINRRIADLIIEKALAHNNNTFLEIGPGLGTITFLLALKVKKVIAVEYDAGFYRYLSSITRNLGYDNVDLIHRDFLHLTEKELMEKGFPSKVVSNFPFSIGIKAVLHILESFKNIKKIYGTVQKEAAERLCAIPGVKNYSMVSVIVQYMANVQMVQNNISPHNFFPAPEVWSAVVEITRREGREENKDFFYRVVKVAFSNRRKSLVNNLSQALEVDKNILSDLIEKKFKNRRIRAENLSVDDFILLSGALQKMVG